MESKATKAAIAEIEKIKSRISHNMQSYYLSDYLRSINKIIDEYGLKDKLDMIESVYDTLMKERYYKEAASFAKKYGI